MFFFLFYGKKHLRYFKVTIVKSNYLVCSNRLVFTIWKWCNKLPWNPSVCQYTNHNMKLSNRSCCCFLCLLMNNQGFSSLESISTSKKTIHYTFMIILKRNIYIILLFCFPLYYCHYSSYHDILHLRCSHLR